MNKYGEKYDAVTKLWKINLLSNQADPTIKRDVMIG